MIYLVSIDSIDPCQIEVEAADENEAIAKACKKWKKEEAVPSVYYAGKIFDEDKI